jgi:uncharacterized protein YndB with AHSA1/START domain
MADIKHTITIEAPPNGVFDTITSKKGLEGWWTSDVKDKDPNDVYTFGFGNHTILMTMRVEKEIVNELLNGVQVNYLNGLIPG